MTVDARKPAGLPKIAVEAMLLGWGETHSGGAKLTLQLASPEELDQFKAMTIAKGKRSGQRLMCVFVQIGDDEKPVPLDPIKPKGPGSKFPGGFCGLAVMWCRERAFLLWAIDQFPDVHGEAMDALGSSDLTEDVVAAWMLKKVCGISSRKELDTDDIARAVFEDQIRGPYAAHRKEIGLE